MNFYLTIINLQGTSTSGDNEIYSQIYSRTNF